MIICGYSAAAAAAADSAAAAATAAATAAAAAATAAAAAAAAISVKPCAMSSINIEIHSFYTAEFSPHFTRPNSAHILHGRIQPTFYTAEFSPHFTRPNSAHILHGRIQPTFYTAEFSPHFTRPNSAHSSMSCFCSISCDCMHCGYSKCQCQTSRCDLF